MTFDSRLLTLSDMTNTSGARTTRVQLTPRRGTAPRLVVRSLLASALAVAVLPVAGGAISTVSAAGAPVTGDFFVDFDRDGVSDSGESLAPGDALYPADGVTVDATDPAGGTVSCTVTGASYSCDVSSLSGTEFRLDFGLSATDEASGFSATVRGPDSATDTQFVSAGGTASFGVTPPSSCPTEGEGFGGNPNSAAGKIWATCFVNGDRDGGGAQDALVGLNFDNTGDIEKVGLKGDQNDSTSASSELGAVWGVAYDEWTSTLFTSAVIRRHADIGAEGVDGVYWVSYPSGTWNSASLGNIAGAPSYGADINRGLEGLEPFDASYDTLGFENVARIGIGDIDTTPDGRRLVVSNLSNKSVDVYDVSAAATGGAPTFVSSTAIANPGCAGDADAYQVWAITTIDSDTAYVGVTCTGEGSSNLPADLQAFVLPVDLAAGTVGAAELTIPLGYTKLCDSNFGGCAGGDVYEAWTDTGVANPQALLSDIDITVDGSMVIGILDRWSLQNGQNNYRYDPTETSTDLIYVVSNGDIIHACNTSGDANAPVWAIEGAGNAACDASANFADTTGGDFTDINNHSGVGGLAEWYGDDLIVNPSDSTQGHGETAQGGLFVDPFGSRVVAGSMNPINFESGGLQWYDTTSGTQQLERELFQGPASAGFAGKATGIGDIEGCTLPIEIGDYVWLDGNGNGIQDGGETPLAGVTVMLLDSGGATIATTVTAADGSYTFATADGLLPDTAYSLMFDVLTMTNTGDLPAGVAVGDLTEATADAGANDAADSDVVGGKIEITTPSAGTNDHSFDAGYTAPTFEYRLGSLVWLDADDDGVADAGESPIAGVSVELLDAAGAVAATTTTDADGEYLFDGLAAGDYSVRIPSGQTALAGLASSGTPNADADGPAGVGVDNDNNGVPSGGSFTSGVVTLGEGSSSDEPTGETNGLTGASDEDGTFPDGRSNLTVDFGFADKATLELGNFVWIDTNNDGDFDAGEDPVPGVTVELVDTSGTVLATTTTSATGMYLFTNLNEGSYMVQIPASNFAGTAPLVGFFPSTGDAASDDPDDGVDSNSDGIRQTDGSVKSGTITLTLDSEPTSDEAPTAGTDDDNSNLTVDFGFYTLSLGDTVWFDDDNSATLDAGEDTAPAGVTVELLDSSGSVIATTTTDADGMYLFDGLEEGDYVLTLPPSNFDPGSPLAGFVSSTGNGATAPDPDDDVDNDDNGTQAGDAITSGTITLSAGDEPADDGTANPTVDFGVITNGSIGSFVFEDFDSNGQFDGDDQPVSGVTVRLLDEDNNVIDTMTTDEDGMYLFDELPPGKYIVEFVAPNGRVFTVANVGNDSTDSDANTSTGRSGVIMLGLGEDILDVDAGIIPALLPETGSDSTFWTLRMALMLVAAGAMIMLASRRRRALRVW